MIRFVKLQKTSDYSFSIKERNDFNMDMLGRLLTNEVRHAEDDFSSTSILNDEEYNFWGNSLIGLEKKDGEMHIYSEDRDGSYIYFFHTTPNNMIRIINRWIDLARTTWQLPDGTMIKPADEILITEEFGEITITRSDGFDPADKIYKDAKPITDWRLL